MGSIDKILDYGRPAVTATRRLACANILFSSALGLSLTGHGGIFTYMLLIVGLLAALLGLRQGRLAGSEHHMALTALNFLVSLLVISFGLVVV